ACAAVTDGKTLSALFNICGLISFKKLTAFPPYFSFGRSLLSSNDSSAPVSVSSSDSGPTSTSTSSSLSSYGSLITSSFFIKTLLKFIRKKSAITGRITPQPTLMSVANKKPTLRKSRIVGRNKKTPAAWQMPSTSSDYSFSIIRFAFSLFGCQTYFYKSQTPYIRTRPPHIAPPQRRLLTPV